MTCNKNSTRYFSSRQEKRVAKAVKGRVVPNSGAIRFGAGDVRVDNWLLECKTCTKPQSTFTMHKEWFDKNKEEAFAMGADYNAVVFDFGDGEQFYAVDENTFKLLLKATKEE